MNYLGHHEVATRLGLDAPARLGAMLPDFATMLGTRLQRDPLPPAVIVGVDVHHATDGAFHRHPSVRAGMGALTASLLAADLPRGAARGAGHVGYEMLLDRGVRFAGIAEALDAGDRPWIVAALGPDADWAQLRTHLVAHPPRYDDIDWVAHRLFDILGRRPRLQFPAAAIPALIAALARAAPELRATVPTIYADVLSDVALNRGVS